MAEKKKFKDTKVGQFLSKAAPKVLDAIGDSFPPVGVIKALVSNEVMSSDDKITLGEYLKEYEAELDYHLENTESARGIYVTSKDITDSLANKIMNWNLPLVMLLVIINILCVKWLDSALLAVISNIIGMAMQKLFEERSAVTNFFFGSSKGSKQKDEKQIK